MYSPIVKGGGIIIGGVGHRRKHGCRNIKSRLATFTLFTLDHYLHILDTTRSEVLKVLVELLHFRPVCGVQTAGEDELSRLSQGHFY